MSDHDSNYGFKSKVTLAAILAGFLCSISVQPMWSSDGKTVFGAKCSGCHTIGKGALVGPDLKDARNWKRADLEADVKRMGAMAGSLSDDEVNALVDYLQSPEKQEQVSSAPTETATPAPVAETEQKVEEEPGSVQEGERLFAGTQRFANGGTSCLSCHSANGGHASLGPDLAKVGTKMNETALVVACEQMPYSTMKAAYKGHAVTHKEALSLAKYLYTLKDNPRKQDPPFSLYGIAGAGLIMLLVLLYYRSAKGPAHERLNRKRK